MFYFGLGSEGGTPWKGWFTPTAPSGDGCSFPHRALRGLWGPNLKTKQNQNPNTQKKDGKNMILPRADTWKAPPVRADPEARLRAGTPPPHGFPPFFRPLRAERALPSRLPALRNPLQRGKVVGHSCSSSF